MVFIALLHQKRPETREFNEERFTKRVIYQNGDSVVFVLHFLPGQELPTHKHPGTDVYLLALEGTGTMIVDGNETVVQQSDVVHISGGEAFAYKNTGEEPSSLYVTLVKLPSPEYARNV
jgi:quercetin dioxygenase-like cupin family protein